ncbi:hypothetical protein ACWCSD_40400 [Nonomuraea sp. NPDC001684]
MTTVTINAPDHNDGDAVLLLPLPHGVKLPRLADYAVTATMPGTPENSHLEELALANLAIATDLENGHDGTPQDAERRESHLLHFHAALSAVAADLGDLNLVVDARQARQIEGTARDVVVHPAAQTVELDPAIVWDLLDAAGHGEHGGWTHDSRWPEVVCACGDAVFRLSVPAPAAR